MDQLTDMLNKARCIKKSETLYRLLTKMEKYAILDAEKDGFLGVKSITLRIPHHFHSLT